MTDIQIAPDLEGCWYSDRAAQQVGLVSLDGEILRILHQGLESPHAIGYDETAGRLWIADGQRLLGVGAEDEVEVETGMPRDIWLISSETKTHGCWILIGGEDSSDRDVIKVRNNGDVICTVSGFYAAQDIAANAFNGGCLVADTGNGRVVRLSSDGTLLGEVMAFGAPWRLAVHQ